MCHVLSRNSVIRNVLTKLPESTVDDLNGQIQAVQNRIAAISEVHDASLAELREKALMVLRDLLEKLQTIKSSQH